MTDADTPPPVVAAGEAPSLNARGLAKTFGGQRALKGVDLAIAPREVVALLGENGSGKSTLVKILAGFHEPDPGGDLQMAGTAVPLPVPAGSARDIGLAFVYQDLGLANGLSVVENLFAGRRVRTASSRPGRLINWKRERSQAREVFARYGVELDPTAMVGSLRPTAQALLAIVRAAEELRGFRERGGGFGGVLVLDEPTVFLPEHEKVFLFDLVRRVIADGTGVLFVSHDMTAVREIAHRAVVLRDGEKVGDVLMSEVTNAELVKLVSGHRLTADALERATSAASTAEPTVAAGAEALVATHISGGRLSDINLSVRAGEIVGVAGLLGSGSEDLPYVLFGAQADSSGTLRCGEWTGDVASLSPAAAQRLGMALVPGDRKQQGAAAELSVETNMLSLVFERFTRRGTLNPGALRATAGVRVETYDVRPRDARLNMAALSGGNQQKVVLARWLERDPGILLLHEPTQGVDVATRHEIYAILRARAQAGAAILWVSTDFDELATACDRILVCARGAIAGELAPPFTRDRITSEVYATQEQAENPNVGAAQ